MKFVKDILSMCYDVFKNSVITNYDVIVYLVSLFVLISCSLHDS